MRMRHSQAITLVQRVSHSGVVRGCACSQSLPRGSSRRGRHSCGLPDWSKRHRSFTGRGFAAPLWARRLQREALPGRRAGSTAAATWATPASQGPSAARAVAVWAAAPLGRTCTRSRTTRRNTSWRTWRRPRLLWSRRCHLDLCRKR